MSKAKREINIWTWSIMKCVRYKIQKMPLLILFTVFGLIQIDLDQILVDLDKCLDYDVHYM